jgi:hypothetical protein
LDIEPGAGERRIGPPKEFHWLVALPLTVWCLLWLLYNGYAYVTLTWNVLRTLGWLSFFLLLNPCFYLWVCFLLCAWGPMMLWRLPWAKYDGAFMSRTTAFLLVVFVPPVLGLALQYLGPYCYPIASEDHGVSYYMRFCPIHGGRGYTVDGR